TALIGVLALTGAGVLAEQAEGRRRGQSERKQSEPRKAAAAPSSSEEPTATRKRVPVGQRLSAVPNAEAPLDHSTRISRNLLAENRDAQLATAREALKQLDLMKENGNTVSPKKREEWSLRVVEAARSTKGEVEEAEAHEARMKDLMEEADRRWKAG